MRGFRLLLNLMQCRSNAADVFQAIGQGAIRAAIGARFPLDQVAEAHRVAEARATTGAILLLP